MQINLDDVRIESGWKEALREEFLSEYFARIKENLLAAKAREIVYPPGNLIFNELTP